MHSEHKYLTANLNFEDFKIRVAVFLFCIQCFLNYGDICHNYFRDMGYFSKYLKGFGILGPPPPPGPHLRTRAASRAHTIHTHTHIAISAALFCITCMREFRGKGGGGKESGPSENHK